VKIVLVNPYLKLNDPPLGLAYMSSYLKERNIDCAIIDKEKNIVKAVKREKPDIVGVSAMLMDYDKIIEMAKAIKQLGVRVIVGGVQITTMPQSLSVFNTGVMGEGEETIFEMASGQNLKKTKGIVYRENGGIVVNEPRPLIDPLDKIPIPDRDALPMKIYLKIRKGSFNKFGRYAGMFTSRGCPYRCAFCSSSSFWKGIRLHSPDRVVEEVRLLIDDYKVDGIIIWDDLFAVSSKRLKLIVEKLKEEKVDIPFQGFARANLINREVCKLLKKMNVTNIAFGLESGSEKILTYLKENVTVKDNLRALKLCKEQGLRTQGNFIIGSPNETEEDIKLTLKLMRNKNLDEIYVHHLTPFPGTKTWEEAKELNLVSDNLEDMDLSQFSLSGFHPDLNLNRTMPKDRMKEWYDIFEQERMKKNYKTEKKNIFRLDLLVKAIKNPREAIKYIFH
jgi:radical SAM superfamily enzyme YgiQ (UPF0313 family)